MSQSELISFLVDDIEWSDSSVRLYRDMWEAASLMVDPSQTIVVYRVLNLLWISLILVAAAYRT